MALSLNLHHNLPLGQCEPSQGTRSGLVWSGSGSVCCCLKPSQSTCAVAGERGERAGEGSGGRGGGSGSGGWGWRESE